VKQANPSEPVLTILQNVDALYWQAVAENAVAVDAGPGAVCVFNSSPLEKYESYRLCLERWNSNDQTDFAPAVYNVIFSLARTLGFRLNSPHNGTQPKYLADALPEVVNVAELGASEHIEDEETLATVEEQGCAYHEGTNTLFIREFRMPYVAVEATRFFYSACRSFSPTKCSLTSQIENALAYFGGRLLYPGSPQERGGSDEEDGERLYRAYVEGRMTRADARRLFLAHIQTAEDAQTVLEQLRSV
jgi:hypothetical protein